MISVITSYSIHYTKLYDEHLAQRREALLHAFGIRRQTQILDHHRRLVTAKLRQRRLTIVSRYDLVILSYNFV